MVPVTEVTVSTFSSTGLIVRWDYESTVPVTFNVKITKNDEIILEQNKLRFMYYYFTTGLQPATYYDASVQVGYHLVLITQPQTA